MQRAQLIIETSYDPKTSKSYEKTVSKLTSGKDYSDNKVHSTSVSVGSVPTATVYNFPSYKMSGNPMPVKISRKILFGNMTKTLPFMAILTLARGGSM